MLTVKCVGMAVQAYISLLDSELKPSEYLYPCRVRLTGFDRTSFIIFKLASAPS